MPEIRRRYWPGSGPDILSCSWTKKQTFKNDIKMKKGSDAVKKIVITGATSMLGTALTEVAVREGTEVYAIVRPDTKRMGRLVPSPLVHPIKGSLENLAEIEGLPADCDVFYHFAWAGTGREARDEPLIHERNIRYTLEAVELAEKAGCRRFVGAGSQAEYGPVDGVIDEETRHNPVTSYGVAKYAAGIMGRKLCGKKGMDHVWGRVFSVYGPHDNEGTMLEYAIACFGKGEAAQFSSATQSWNYLYESDAGEMFYAFGEDRVPSGTWLVANPESRPLREYIDVLMKVYGPGAKAEFAVPTSVQAPGLKVDAEKTMEAINYRPRTSFEEGICKMIRAKAFENSGGGTA